MAHDDELLAALAPLHAFIARLQALLATRPHVLNKPEGKIARRQAAKGKGPRGVSVRG
jgi:hypothetical protein